MAWAYFVTWRGPFWEFAPNITACLAFYVFMALDTWKHWKTVRIVPYFQKGEVRIETETFVKGHALARCFTTLESLAAREGCEPLSTFGFADDWGGGTPIWHDAARGKKTVVTLLTRCETEIESLEGVNDDLDHLKLALEDATRKNVPFCLLLRHGNVWSLGEMNVRQGHFGFLPR